MVVYKSQIFIFIVKDLAKESFLALGSNFTNCAVVKTRTKYYFYHTHDVFTQYE